MINNSTSICTPIDSEIDPCDMIDYHVHESLDIGRARAQAKQLIQGHLATLKSAKKPKNSVDSSGGKLKQFPSKFCDQLIRATVCNILFPPCEGEGNQRYRKPCMGFDLAIKMGCGLDLSFGDMTFAYPPDCYELPIVSRQPEMQYDDADMIGSLQTSSRTGNSLSASRAADLIKLGVLLQDGAETEHAAHMLMSALRYSPHDSEAHTRRVSTQGLFLLL